MSTTVTISNNGPIRLEGSAAPLDREWSLKGGPYSAGVYKPSKGEGCFGLVEVTDLGRELKVHFGGRNNEDREVLSLDVTVPAP